ncbi:MAG: TrmB family transcriptional regulator [Methanobrevibacter sp.]|nr:TrmB family transcriptional regulator [Methanobrevibacter sp.]
MDNKTIDSLKKLGLSTYQALVYLSLTYMISGTASEISTNSSVPRSKIYDVLKILGEKGFVDIERGRPLKYHVVPPKEVFQHRKEKILEELEETEMKLNYAYESQLSKIPAPIWLIHGTERIIKKELEIISRAKKTVNIRMGFLFKNEIDQLIEKFNRLIKRGVEINILASPYSYVDNKKINIIRELKDSEVNIMKADLPFVKMIVRDGKEMIHIFTKFSGKERSVISNTAIGVWNQYEDIAKNYDERFFNIWNRKARK